MADPFLIDWQFVSAVQSVFDRTAILRRRIARGCASPTEGEKRANEKGCVIGSRGKKRSKTAAECRSDPQVIAKNKYLEMDQREAERCADARRGARSGM
jgi:hypothetical protein